MLKMRPRGFAILRRLQGASVPAIAQDRGNRMITEDQVEELLNLVTDVRDILEKQAVIMHDMSNYLFEITEMNNNIIEVTNDQTFTK